MFDITEKRRKELLEENTIENEKYLEELNKIPVQKDRFNKKVLEFLKNM